MLAAAGIRSRLSDRARDWARRRQGRDGRSVHLSQQRVYILPTATGLILGLVVFTMLLGSLNYSNNMGFALTFLLAGLGLVAMREAHRNLAGLDLTVAWPTPVFAGQDARIQLTLSHDGGVERLDIGAGWASGKTNWTDVPAGRPATLALKLPTRRRGYMDLPPIRVSTCWPFGLFRCWAWIHSSTQVLVYPAPADQVADIPRRPPEEDGDAASGSRPGAADFLRLREYRVGDPRSRIAWKASARRGEILVREHVDAESPTDWLSWDQVPAPDDETRIARLTRLCLEADAAGRPFGLRVPGTTIPPDTGTEHRHRSLACLATLGQGDPRQP